MLFVILTCRQQHHLIELLAKLECKAPFKGPSSTPGSPRLSPLKATVPFTSVETSTTSEVENSKVLSMHTSYSGHCNCLKGSLANLGFIIHQRKLIFPKCFGPFVLEKEIWRNTPREGLFSTRLPAWRNGGDDDTFGWSKLWTMELQHWCRWMQLNGI